MSSAPASIDTSMFMTVLSALYLKERLRITALGVTNTIGTQDLLELYIRDTGIRRELEQRCGPLKDDQSIARN